MLTRLVIRLALLILMDASGDLTATRLSIAVELTQDTTNVAAHVTHHLIPSMEEPS